MECFFSYYKSLSHTIQDGSGNVGKVNWTSDGVKSDNL